MANWGNTRFTDDQDNVKVTNIERVKDTNPKTYFERGKYFEENGDYESAEQEYMEAVKYSGEYVGYFNKAAVAFFYNKYSNHLLETGEYSQAEEKQMLSQKIRKDLFLLAEFYCELGKKYGLEGNYELAEKQYYRAMELKSRYDSKGELLKFYYSTNIKLYEEKANKMFYWYCIAQDKTSSLMQIIVLVLFTTPVFVFGVFSFAYLLSVIVMVISLAMYYIYSKKHFINCARERVEDNRDYGRYLFLLIYFVSMFVSAGIFIIIFILSIVR